MNTSPLIIGLVTWVVVFAAAMIGIWIGARLPESLRTDDSRNVENETMLDLVARAENKAALLVPVNDTQRWLQPHILDVSEEVRCHPERWSAGSI